MPMIPIRPAKIIYKVDQKSGCQVAPLPHMCIFGTAYSKEVSLLIIPTRPGSIKVEIMGTIPGGQALLIRAQIKSKSMNLDLHHGNNRRDHHN